MIYRYKTLHDQRLGSLILSLGNLDAQRFLGEAIGDHDMNTQWVGQYFRVPRASFSDHSLVGTTNLALPR